MIEQTAPGGEYDDFVEDILDESESSTPPQPPAAPAAAPAPSADQPADAETGPARDERGRFVSRPAVDDSSATEALGAPAPSETPAEAEATGAQPSAQGDLRDAEGTPYPEWSFRADRQTISIPGSAVGEEGVFIPKGQLERVQQLLAEGQAHRGSWRSREQAYQQEIDRLKTAQDEEVARARAFNEGLLELMQQGPEAMASWLDDYQTNFPRFMAEAEKRALEGRLAAQQEQLDEWAAEREAERVEPLATDALNTLLDQMAARYGVRQRDAMAARIRDRLLDQVFYEVSDRPYLEPGEVLVATSEDGQRRYVLNAGMIEQEYKDVAQLAGPVAAAAQAVQQNAARMAPTGAPPAMGVGGAPPPGRTPAPLPKTPEELDKWLESGAWKQSFPTG